MLLNHYFYDIKEKYNMLKNIANEIQLDSCICCSIFSFENDILCTISSSDVDKIISSLENYRDYYTKSFKVDIKKQFDKLALYIDIDCQ